MNTQSLTHEDYTTVMWGLLIKLP